MAAIFYEYAKDSILKHSVDSTPETVFSDFLKGIQSAGATSSAIITQIGMHINDTLQFFLTFDDVIKYYYFGKGLGNLTIDGILFQDCNFEIVGLPLLLDKISFYRGKTVDFSWGNKAFKGVMTDVSFSKISEPETMINFQVSFALIWHNLGNFDQAPVC